MSPYLVVENKAANQAFKASRAQWIEQLFGNCPSSTEVASRVV